jgi:Coenzyme PQQ synthesis protein D (PqqD)
MSESPDLYPKMAEGLEINVVSDGYVVHDARSGRIHYLNQTSSVILELCNGTVAESHLPRLLQLSYELAEAPVADVAECLAALRREGLIV